MISVFRIDERLVHGQVAYSWSVEYRIDRIMVIDDKVAKDEIQKMTLRLAVPADKKLSIFSINEAIEFLKKNETTNEKLFIVVKDPEVVLKLIESNITIKSINVGGMYYKEGKKKISKTVYIDDKDIEVFKKLRQAGVEAEIRTSPKDKKINLYKYI